MPRLGVEPGPLGTQPNVLSTRSPNQSLSNIYWFTLKLSHKTRKVMNHFLSHVYTIFNMVVNSKSFECSLVVKQQILITYLFSRDLFHYKNRC